MSDPHRDSAFATSDKCALCHSGSSGANAMRTKTGDDVSPVGTWQATMMANSFRDPYFRAQLQKETASQGEAVQELCLRCHAPMAHHQALKDGKDAPRLGEVKISPLAEDGVSCTVCHQIVPEGLGTEATFSGRPKIGNERKIFGPYEDPATGPMLNAVRYTPTQGMHMRESGLCATCHTLITEHQGKPFPEQTPYFEWRNSEFSTERGPNESARSCQECHMARVGRTRIARNPMGGEFLIPPRDDVAAHGFVGGNAFMLDLLRKNRRDLEVTADEAALERMAKATRRQLGEDTASLHVGELHREDGKLAFTVRVENRTGHKFPTGYPARRAWLHVQVRSGGKIVFESGAFDENGRLLRVADEGAIPHRNLVEKPEDVVVYEMVALGPDGKPTTYLTKMTQKQKDNRLLPRGYRADGPHAAETAPSGLDGDADFVAGGDTVSFRVPLAEDAKPCQVLVWMLYQSVPPHWVDALRTVDHEDCRNFVQMYDKAEKLPETIDIAQRMEAR